MQSTLTKIDILPGQRCWVYIANRPISEEELSLWNESLEAFQKTWSAHGQLLKSQFQWVYNQILIVAVDELQAKTTGCSLDKKVSFLKAFQNSVQIELFDRSKIYVIQDHKIKDYSKNEFRKAYEVGLIDQESPVINTLVNHSDHLNSSLVLPIKNSWHFKLLK